MCEFFAIADLNNYLLGVFQQHQFIKRDQRWDCKTHKILVFTGSGCAQLALQLLPPPEDPCLNPAVSNLN